MVGFASTRKCSAGSHVSQVTRPILSARFIGMRIALIIAFLPIALAFITSLINGTSMFDEGSGSGGYLWLLMGSVPLGVAIFVIAAIVKLIKRRK